MIGRPKSCLRVPDVITAIIVYGISLVGGNVWADSKESNLESAPSDVDVVILGASYAAGWRVAELAGLTFANKGIGGQESNEMRARFEKDVIALKPRFVIIWGFINDVFRSEQAGIRERLKRTRDDIQAMVESARNSGIEPILATEVTTTEPAGFVNAIRGFVGRLRGKQSYAKYVSTEVSMVNEWQRNYAKEHSIPLLDIERLFADEDGLRKRIYAQDDGSHITTAGYEALTEYARQHLLQMVSR